MTTFFRLLGEANKENAMKAVCAAFRHGIEEDRAFRLSPDAFLRIPGAPFAYWAGEPLLAAYSEYQSYEPDVGTVRVGAQTDDDFRFVRVHWEVNRSANAKDWPYYLKGDNASPFYDDIKTVVNWKDDAKEMKQFITQALRGGHWSRHIFNSEVYFRPGLSWALRTSKFVPSCVPEGCIPSVSRYLAIPDKYSALALVGMWNSSLVDALCKLRMERHGHPKFIVGVVKTLPTPALNRDQETTLKELAYRAWLLKRALQSVNEDSHAYILPVTLRNRIGIYSPQAIEAELAEIQDSITHKSTAVP